MDLSNPLGFGALGAVRNFARVEGCFFLFCQLFRDKLDAFPYDIASTGLQLCGAIV